MFWKHSPIWDIPIEEFERSTDREISQKYGCSISLSCRVRMHRTGVRRQAKTDPLTGEAIEDTYEMRFQDVEQKEKELREREYERCRATGCVWQKGDPVENLSPGLRSFVERYI